MLRLRYPPRRYHRSHGVEPDLSHGDESGAALAAKLLSGVLRGRQDSLPAVLACVEQVQVR